MPEDTSKLLGLIEDLAIIAEDAINTDEVLDITINKNHDHPVRVQLKSMEKIKRHYPDKVKVEDYSEEYFKESIILFDNVQVFCLTFKPHPEVDINVVESAQAASI